MTDRKRSAITGEFVTAEYAEKHPDTTISEQRDRLAGLLDETRRSGCAVEIAGVRIAPCDERGQTADMRALAHMTEARDNWRAEAKRLAERIEAAKQIGTHLGRPWADVVNDMLRALDGKDL